MAMNNLKGSESIRAQKPRHAPWIASLARLSRGTEQNAETRMRTVISCDVQSGRQAIYVPSDMSALQPRSLRYLSAFARRHDLQLIEDRRRVAVNTVTERRNHSAPVFAKALGELLKQLGMPGAPRRQSQPHRLRADSPHIDITKLISMAAYAAPNAKKIRIQPNRTLIDVLGNHDESINVYACKLMSADSQTVLSQFDAPHFRAIGYSAGSQYVMHVCVAGGSISDPALWANFHTLTRSDFRFQLFSASNPKDDIGLLYATFYLDVAQAPSPWWINAWSDAASSANENRHIPMLHRAG